MQFSNSLRLGKVGSLIDSDVRAFAAASGATDLGGLNDLVKYVKAQSLWNNFRIYPMKSAQNAGSGLTVHGLGGLTANNMTLANSPPWGAGGIAFNGTSQYGDINDFLGSETQTWFSRITQTSSAPTTIQAIAQQFNNDINDRAFAYGQWGTLAGDPYRILRSSDGINSDLIGESAGSLGSTSDRLVIAQHVAGGSVFMWHNKTSVSLSYTGSATSKFNSSGKIRFAAGGGDSTPTAYAAMTGHAFSIITSSITTTQRETITDLINAL